MAPRTQPTSSAGTQRSRDGTSSRTTEEPIQPFRYSSLDVSKRSIRVIRVQPELSNGMIACKLEHMDTSSQYRALSYTWGNPHADRYEILLNGQIQEVGLNLWMFLSHARRYQYGRALWIDALCIDQESMDERNHQVQMMSEIYSNTMEVLVWLGPRNDYFVEYAMKYMRFKKINIAEYWDRVWIIQEFVQPARGKIIQGDSCVSFRTFEKTIDRLEKPAYRKYLQKHFVFGSRRKNFLETYMSSIHPLWQRRAARWASSDLRKPEESWPLSSGNRYCADVRDRVYGVLPLATHGAELDVDYRLNPFQLMLESIWLEHDSEEDRSEILIALADILELTPRSICMYSQDRAPATLRRMRRLPDNVKTLHLEAASSPAALHDWRKASHFDAAGWENFSYAGLYVPRQKRLHFPDRSNVHGRC